MKLSFKKLNQNYEAHPVEPPILIVSGDKISLKIILNYNLQEEFKDKKYGRIQFVDCLMFRMGDPNDEGLYATPDNTGPLRNDSRWNSTDFPELVNQTGNFFLVENSDWQTHFGPHPFVNSEVQRRYTNLEIFSHYILFTKDETFECIAKSYIETVPWY